MDDLPNDKRIEIIDSSVENLPILEQKCPALWIQQNSDQFQKWQKEYLRAGCSILAVPIMGLNQKILEQCGHKDEGERLIREMVELTRETAQGRARVAAILGELGLSFHAEEQMPFEDLINIYKVQINNSLRAGVDLFVVEGTQTIKEARAALLAVKESCSLPVWVMMPFDEEGKTEVGADVLSSLIILQDMGVDGFGMSQKIGPKDMYRHLEKIAPFGKVKLAAKPEAFWSKEEEEGGRRQMTPKEFGIWSKEIVRFGTGLLGGGNGAGPTYIKEAASQTMQTEVCISPLYKDSDEMVVATYGAVHFLTPAFDFTHTISCSTHMGAEIMDCEAEGASAIKVFVESQDDVECLSENLYMMEMPLCIATHDIDLLSQIARIYSGTLLFDNTEEIPKEQLEPLCKKYGMLIIGQ